MWYLKVEFWQNDNFQDPKNLDKFGGKIEEIFGAKRRKQNNDEDDINGEAPSPISHQKIHIQCKLSIKAFFQII